MSKKPWTPGELDTLARALMQAFPDRQFEKASRIYDIRLHDLEITRALQQALPVERHGERPKLARLKRDLLPALARISGRAGQGTAVPPESPQEAAGALPEAPVDIAPVAATAPPQEAIEPVVKPTRRTRRASSGEENRKEKVRWTDDEWRFLALALHTLCPELDLVNASSMKGITLNKLNQAASMMDPGRQRTFKWLGHAIDRVQKIYADARAARDPFYFGKKRGAAAAPEAEADADARLEAEAAATPAPEPVQSPEPSAPAAPIPRAIEKAPHRPVSEARIFWSRAEWIEIAAEIDRLHPNAKYPERGTCGGLTTVDIMHAQRVLPPERRRHLRTQPIDKMRPPLLEAFREVKKVKAELLAAQHQQARAAHEERRNAPPPNPYEQALRPLIELIAREVTNQVSAQVLPALLAALAANQPALGVQGAASVPRLVSERPPRLRVGVVNNRLTFADELTRAFPEIDFTFADIDHGNSTDSVANCDRVIVLTKFVSHPAANRVKKAVGDRFVPLHGSLSDIKRVLSGWLANGVAKVA